MKVQLVLPKCDNPGARLIRGWPQPLGLLSIATYLRQKDQDVEIEILDGTILSHKEIEDSIDADIVGITTISRAYLNALRIAEKAKHLGARVILGGQHATALSDVILNNRPYVDAIVRYDGEKAFSDYVAGVSLDQIENLVYRQPHGRCKHNRVELVDVNTLPVADRGFLALEPYDANYAKYIGGFFKRAGTICTQRGCWWRAQRNKGCVFCAIPDPGWRPRSPELVWHEVETLARSGFELLYDVADDIGADKEWLREMCRIKPSTNMRFLHYLSAKHTDEETIQLLLKLGTVQVFIGFESADSTCLARMQKEATEQDNRNAIRTLERHNMRLIASFVGGVPGETRDSLNRTLSFARYLSELPIIDRIHWDTLKPVPGSRAFRMVLDHPDYRGKYEGNDAFDMKEMTKDWVQAFCSVDYDYLCQIEDEAEVLVSDSATYTPLSPAYAREAVMNSTDSLFVSLAGEG